MVGGGPVAERKVEGLLAADADVTVVSPTLTELLASHVASGRIRHHARPYRAGDLHGMALAFTALDEPEATKAVAAEARERGVWLNAADDPAHCDFILPGVVRRGALTIAVASGGDQPGGDPGAARAPRLRAAGRSGRRSPSSRPRRVAICTPPAPRPTESGGVRALGPAVRALVADGRVDDARRRLRASSSECPNDAAASRWWGPVRAIPGLMTVRGLALLRQRAGRCLRPSVDPRLLDEAPPRALRVFVGKASGAHTLPQAEINALLVAHARRGQRVVRLKGGDPFVFGRGGEEAEALAAAGIPFEVVPGVSSAVAAPAAAGIPVTHRAVASSFAVVTGHEDDRRSFSRVDWAALATAVDTLVILMGLENLPRIARALRQAGRAAETPAAVIERGATTGQRVVVGRLDTIATRVAAAGVRSPAVIVVGDVVALRPRLLGAAADGSGEVGVGAGEQGVGAEAELGEELMQVLLGAR